MFIMISCFSVVFAEPAGGQGKLPFAAVRLPTLAGYQELSSGRSSCFEMTYTAKRTVNQAFKGFVL
jgi:hypothetical protein